MKSCGDGLVPVLYGVGRNKPSHRKEISKVSEQWI